MSFCSFSKEFGEHKHTEIENKFIAKYLPEADGFSVKVYLYGLYLCGLGVDFNISSMAEILKSSEEEIQNAFYFWQDYDLVEIMCKDPFTVSYLSVNNTVGRPKKVNYERYSDFNKELQRSMQQVGKSITYNDFIKYMHFLEENEMQPQAFLLIAEYCIRKKGEEISPSYIFNKARKFIQNGLFTYEQVEKELSGYNAHESEVLSLFSALSIYSTKPDESDYSLYASWLNKGFSKESILLAAKHMKRGTMEGLNRLLLDLFEKEKIEATDVEDYLTKINELSNLTFKIGRKLGVKISNPAPFIEEYTEKWYNYGFEETSLLNLALFLLRKGTNSFTALDILIDDLFRNGIISDESVNEYLKAKNNEIKLFTRIQSYCGTIKTSEANLSLVTAWRNWNFSDEMILEAAKRSASSASPIPYMNKILSDWKRENIYTITDIPEKTTYTPTKTYENTAVKAINDKNDRERYYANLRENAQAIADRATRKANANPEYKEVAKSLAKMEISLAKAEISTPEKLPALNAEKIALLRKKRSLLDEMGIKEEELTPKYSCSKCSDTGFLPNGKACDCYK